MSRPDASKVAIVGPETLIGAGISCLIDSLDEFEVLPAGRNADHAAPVLRETGAAIVLFYASATATGGAELVAEMKAYGLSPAFLAILEPDDVATARECIRAEVSTAITTTSKPEALLEALRACREGKPYFANEVRVLAATDPKYAALTQREREILREIASGYTSRAIAEHLGIAYKTVESHRQNIARKLDARGVADLVKHAIRAGLADLH